MKNIVALLVLAMAMGVSAQNNSSAYPTDIRIKKVIFQENNVVPIQGITFTTTQIQFGPGERVLDIEGGDSSAWMVTYHPELANMLFIKPTIFDSHTNMTVMTNQHTYYFQLSSNKQLETDSNEQTYALKFLYPTDSTNIATTTTKPAITQPHILNADYHFSGSPQLVPLHVFDDGKFTYFELSAQGPAPAIFAVDDKNGVESTVNTRRQGKYLVVQRLAPQFTLRQGALTTSVFNAREIKRIAQNRRPQ